MSKRMNYNPFPPNLTMDLKLIGVPCQLVSGRLFPFINNEMSLDQKDTVHDKFQDRWKLHFKGYDDLVAKLRDPSYVVRGDVAINQVNRAIISQAYIKENFPKGSRILDAACGNGFLSNYLLSENAKMYFSA